jgi:hypothetical protein
MVYKLIFMIDLDYVQSIKLLVDDPLSLGCMTCLFNCLYVRFYSLRDEPVSGLYMPLGVAWLSFLTKVKSSKEKLDIWQPSVSSWFPQ